MATATGLTISLGGRVLFQDASLQLNPGQHYGLVGANGAGKSTLIRVLSGEITPDQGAISIPTQCKLGILKQDLFLYEETPIQDIVLMGNSLLWETSKKREGLLSKSLFDQVDCDSLAAYDAILEKEGAYEAIGFAGSLLEGLGIKSSLHSQPLKVLSGGYKLRVLLAQLLFGKPDLLLLDEPTNHLDIFSIEWLQEYLKNFPGPLLISSHDRSFLNKVSTHIIDIDHETIRTYKGNYDAFESLKLAHRQHNEALYEKQEQRRNEMLEFITRFKAKASKARQAQSRMRFAEKLEDEMAELDLSPSSRCYLNLSFEQTRPSTAIPLKVSSISKAYGNKRVLENVSFEVNRGERIAFLGANGVGKSTLLSILVGGLTADTGTFQWGFASHFSYFPQDHKKEVQGTLTLLDWLRQFDPSAGEERLRNILGRVLFSGDNALKSVDVLSGGETARLILAKMMLQKHNILIFDEPTNHLDIEAIESLLEALKNYPGTLLLVSHNAYFVSKIATRIIEIREEGLKDFQCPYTEYLEKREEERHSLPTKIKEKESIISDYEMRKNLQREKNQLKKKVELAEKRCSELENALKQIDERLASDRFYEITSIADQQGLLKEKKSLEEELKRVLQEWEEASINCQNAP